MYTCILPGGYTDTEHVVHREVDLSPLNGHEEEILARAVAVTSASLVTTILCSCIKRLGAIHHITEELCRSLSVGDRQFLILRLRELTFGDRVDATISCPWPDCGERVDINFHTTDVPVKPAKQNVHIHKFQLSPDAAVGTAWAEKNNCISFRLPNGGDQEILAPILHENEAEALTQLLGRCVHSLGDIVDPNIDLIRELTPLARLEIEKEMEAVSPALELNMETSCPECGRRFTAPFDLQEFFFGEFRISQEHLYREVHYLAYHYHWSEQEIMDFPREKRRQYIEVLAEEIERLNDATA